MGKDTVLIVLTLILIDFSEQSHVFHENTNINFQPEYNAELFGFSILLSHEGVLVGAPKALDVDNRSGIKPGMVFNCSFEDFAVKNVTCEALKKTQRRPGSEYSYSRFQPGFLKDDMWFGATMVSLPNGRLMINAPRCTNPYGRKHMLMNGASFLQSTRGNRVFYPLKEYNRQAHVTDGARKEFGEYGTHLNYYAYGEAGMSAALTKMNTVIIGAPGLLQWTGGIVSISFSPNDTGAYLNKQPTANPYFTKDLGPDDYFGYSVASGTFQKGGDVLYVAGAPRHNIASGQVLIFDPPTDEFASLNVKAKLTGTQSGSYFGASLCCTDINGDGLDDLLVGAPTYVKNDAGLPYDQGAVFVYITKEEGPGFILEERGRVLGSGANGAWFGITIADLGDVDGDGLKDIAVGAPYEDDGIGAVYIYKGFSDGIKTTDVQRIQPEGAKGFGWSIAKGIDVDNNNCNDLAIGAHNSQTSYLYRCTPTMSVHAAIQVPDAINLPQNTTNFTAVFCVTAPSMKSWPNVGINITGNIEVDPEFNRAMIAGDTRNTFFLKPGKTICDEQTIEVNPAADLSKPISIIYQLEPKELMDENSTQFIMNAARLSEHSTLKTSFLIQLVRDCGEDLICTPWLLMKLDALDNPYIPGSETKLGARLTIFNKEEPAYGGKVNISLPMPPKRIPSECSLQALEMICDVPSPLLRGEEIVWEIELDYHINHEINETKDIALYVTAELTDPLYRNVTDDTFTELVIDIKHEANITVTGKVMPNETIVVLRDNLAAGANVSFKHYFEITNHGPSDWLSLIVHIILPHRTTVSNDISGCRPANFTSEPNVLKCVWSVPAKVSYPVYIPLQMDLSQEGDFLSENTTFNATTYIFISYKPNFTSLEVTTTLLLEPESVTWTLILICVLLGLLLLAAIVTILYKKGFFQRRIHRMLQEQMQNDSQLRLIQESEGSSSSHTNEEDDYVPLDDSED